MDHDEHPAIGCVRETLEELGLEIVLTDQEPVITQNIFNDEGISFVSFTYRSTWNGSLDELTLQTEEIAAAAVSAKPPHTVCSRRGRGSGSGSSGSGTRGSRRQSARSRRHLATMRQVQPRASSQSAAFSSQ